MPNMNRMQIVKASVWLLILLVIGGCQYSTDSITTIKTQSKSSVELSASEYSVNMTFIGKGVTQVQATENLALLLLKFEEWIKSQSLYMTAGMANVSGVYQYRPNEDRKLTGYESRQELMVSQMNFTAYQLLMSKGPQFKPDNMQLLAVVASQADKALARTELIEQAFKLAKQKAEAMAKAAGLCELSVLEISENIQDSSRPRVMQMAMSSEAVHQTESKQTIGLELNVIWNAHQCD